MKINTHNEKKWAQFQKDSGTKRARFVCFCCCCWFSGVYIEQWQHFNRSRCFCPLLISLVGLVEKSVTFKILFGRYNRRNMKKRTPKKKRIKTSEVSLHLGKRKKKQPQQPKKKSTQSKRRWKKCSTKRKNSLEMFEPKRHIEWSYIIGHYSYKRKYIYIFI